jgi:hypothetical protein
MHLATRLIVAVLVSALLYACDSGSSPSDTNNDPSAPVAIGTDTLDLVLTERETVIHFSKDSIVAWKRTDKCTEGKIVPDSLRTTYTLTAGEDDNAMLTQTNCHQVNINCDWQLSVAMDGITAGTWNATTFTRSAHYGNTWSKTAYIDESDSTVALTLSSTEVKTVITRHYCYSDNWTDPDDQWDVTVATQGCASATFTLDDGTQATTRLESATADGSQLSYSITYQGTTCSYTHSVLPTVATASQCSTAWQNYSASDSDHFYWDDWMAPKYDLFEQCMSDANFPTALTSAMQQVD